MRIPLMAGNWKMNGDTESARRFIDEFTPPAGAAGSRQIAICAPFTLLHFLSGCLKEKNSAIALGAQNVHHEPRGAFTGEISVGMLKELGVVFCIVGHSERREYNRETDADVNRKMNALMEGGITPIVCVGETLEQRESGRTREVVEAQVKGSILASAGARDLSGIVAAYEPVWAIGTGKTATPEQAEEVCALIRGLLGGALGADTAGGIRILYGGSMNAKNVDELMKKENIDGGLVGGASLKAAEFSRIAAFVE